MPRKINNLNTEWVGTLPVNWEITKISNLYKLRNTKVSDKDYEPLSVTKQGILPQLENVAKTDAHDDRKLVKVGDFVINSRSDRRGSCGISDFEGSVSLINTVMKPRKIINPSYFNWLFHSTQFSDEFYKWGHGIVADLWTTNWQDMKHINIPYPPLEEQQLIANFLDKKCSEIDTLISNIQKQIEALQEYKKSVITEVVTKGLDPDVEMKDSGSYWIGAIPVTWNTIKTKYVIKIENGSDPSTEGNTPVYGSGSCSFKTCGEYKEGPTVLLGRKGATLHIPHYIEGRYWNVDTAFNTFPIEERINLKYFYYVAFCFDYNRYISQTTLPGMTQTSYRNISIPYPPKKVQNVIVLWLDRKIDELDSVIAKKEALICYECKCTDISVSPKAEGTICFYNNIDDTEGHKRIIKFMIDNRLIRKTKTGRYYNNSFKLDTQTIAGDYGPDFEAILKLDKIIDLNTGEFVI